MKTVITHSLNGSLDPRVGDVAVRGGYTIVKAVEVDTLARILA